MSKVTSKLQVTIPKTVAAQIAVAPGDDVEWVVEGGSVRLVPGEARARLGVRERLALFDAATERQRGRRRERPRRAAPAGRGWGRDELYRRGGAR